MHEFCHAEATFWLRTLDSKCDRMPNYHGGDDCPESNGEPRRTFPTYHLKEGPGIMILRKTEPGEDPPNSEAMTEELFREETRCDRERLGGDG